MTNLSHSSTNHDDSATNINRLHSPSPETTLDGHHRPNGFRRSLSWVSSKTPNRKPKSIIKAVTLGEEAFYNHTIHSLRNRSSTDLALFDIERPNAIARVANRALTDSDIASYDASIMGKKPSNSTGDTKSHFATKPKILQKSFSSDILPSISGLERDLDRALHKSRIASVQKIAQLGPESSKRKDELWSTFRSLDSAFSK